MLCALGAGFGTHAAATGAAIGLGLSLVPLLLSPVPRLRALPG